MGNKPLNDVNANTNIKCDCFNKTGTDELVIRKNLGDSLVVKNNRDVEVVYRYKKKTRKGHVYSSNFK
jgi:hypothetical protein